MATNSALLSVTNIRNIYFLGNTLSWLRKFICYKIWLEKKSYVLLPNLFALSSENIFTDLVSVIGWKQVVEKVISDCI